MRNSLMLVVMLAMAVSHGWPSSVLGATSAYEGEKHDEVAHAEAADAKNYVCPMHPEVQSDKPGECPKCGMTLKEMSHEEMSGEDSHEGRDHEHHQHEHHQ